MSHVRWKIHKRVVNEMSRAFSLPPAELIKKFGLYGFSQINVNRRVGACYFPLPALHIFILIALRAELFPSAHSSASCFPPPLRNEGKYDEWAGARLLTHTRRI